MLVRNIYFVRGVKHYPAFTGDSATDDIKLLVPANSVDDAKEAALNYSVSLSQPTIDEIKEVRLLYKLEKGLNQHPDGTWQTVNGIDNNIILI